MLRRVFDKLRRPDKNKKNPLAYIFFALVFAMIIFAFVFMDPGMTGGGMMGGGAALRVGPTTIPLYVYRNHVQALERRMGFALNSGNEQMANMFRRRIQQQAVNEIVNKEVLQQIQSDEGLVVSDAQVSKFILDLDFLKENGHFQRSRYENFLANQGMTPDRFEEDLRKDLRFELLRDLFVEAYKNPSIEQEINTKVKNLKMELDYVSISPEALKVNLSLTDTEAEEFLAKAENLAKAQSFYDRNASRFTSPDKVKARLILILADGATEEAFVKAEERLAEVTQNLSADNFADVAKEHSEDPTSKEGGDLGYVEKGTYAPEWDEVAFKTKVGEISKPFKTAAGWMRLLVEEKLPSEKQKFGAVKLEIARELHADTQVSEALEQLKNLARDKKWDELQAALKTYGLNWQTTPRVSLDTLNIPGLGSSERLVSAVLALPRKGDIHPGLLSVDGKNYLVRRGEIKEEAEPAVKGPENFQMYEARRVDQAFAAWLDLQKADIKINMGPALQAELATN